MKTMMIYPSSGLEGEVARVLLDLADNPADVATSTDTAGNGSLAFRVPEELGKRFEAEYFKSHTSHPLQSSEPKPAEGSDVKSEASATVATPTLSTPPAAKSPGSTASTNPGAGK